MRTSAHGRVKKLGGEATSRNATPVSSAGSVTPTGSRSAFREDIRRPGTRAVHQDLRRPYLGPLPGEHECDGRRASLAVGPVAHRNPRDRQPRPATEIARLRPPSQHDYGYRPRSPERPEGPTKPDPRGPTHHRCGPRGLMTSPSWVVCISTAPGCAGPASAGSVTSRTGRSLPRWQRGHGRRPRRTRRSDEPPVASLVGVPISGPGLSHLKALPELNWLDVKECKLNFEDIDDFQVACPSVKLD